MWMCEQFALQKRTVETDGLATARGTERGAAQQQLSDDVAGSTTDVASATVKLLLESSWGKKNLCSLLKSDSKTCCQMAK